MKHAELHTQRFYFRAVSTRCAFYLLCFIALAACNKLPKETTTGKNTFGCRLDGKIWNTYTDHWLDRSVEPEYEDGYLTIQAERDGNPRGGRFHIHLADSAGLHTRTYNAATDDFYATFSSWEDNYDLFVTDTNDVSSTLTVTHFTPPSAPGEDAIVSGTFSFTVTAPNTGKKYAITDGRFDVKAH